MSQENLEIVTRAQPSGADLVQLFQGADADFAAAGIDFTVFESDCEVEFMSGEAGASMRPSSPGLQGLAEGWSDWLEPWESYYIEVEEFIDAGDEVVSLVRVRARTTRGAVTVEHRPAAVWTVKEGKITRVSFYLKRSEALEAAGLRE
jgi:ketosteroid isomerase-like protein